MFGFRNRKKAEVPREEVPAVGPPDRGPCRFGVLPAIKGFLRDKYMQRFLNKMYAEEIARAQGKCWSHVAHASSNPALSSMNVAMPDLSCEYWCTFVPAGQVPVVEVTYPRWASYSALTLYGSDGMPITSVNVKQAAAWSSNKIQRLGGERYRVSLMNGESYSGATCLIYRIYRPDGVEIIPHDELPSVSYQGSPPLPCATLQEALDNGNTMAADFVKLIGKVLKPLAPTQIGTQFFAPANVAGLFPNANAQYVITFRDPEKTVLRMAAQVPPRSQGLTYYGIMTVCHQSTETYDTLTFEGLGGWGARFELFVSDVKDEAVHAGYDEGNPQHKWLCWGANAVEPGLVLRFLHYYEDTCGLSEAACLAANAERDQLQELNGTLSVAQACPLPGVGIVNYIDGGPPGVMVSSLDTDIAKVERMVKA